MSKRRFRQDPHTHELVEILEDRLPDSRTGDSVLWGDTFYENQGTTGGEDISSRSKHRAYMKREGLTTFDDFKGEFAQKQIERDEYHSGKRGTVTRKDIERAIYDLNQGR